ncbi:hypothetical protein, partial [Bacillus mobilis]|uniref:hypothetical protein n=1 Tax=Bacillus mobilis TaxID=2026190 RepID=UPI0022E92EFD
SDAKRHRTHFFNLMAMVRIWAAYFMFLFSEMLAIFSLPIKLQMYMNATSAIYILKIGLCI